MDALSNILESVKISSAVYFNSDFSSPWGMEIPKGPFAQFHLITKGQCLLKINDQTIPLFGGDIVVFPFGASHWLADSPESKRLSGRRVVDSIRNNQSIFEGQNVSTSLMCGHFEFNKHLNHRFIQELPEVIHIKDTERKELNWLKSITELLIQEVASESSGSNIVVNKLGEILFIHTIRAYLLRKSDTHGFLAALQDHRISRALKLIHNNPEKEWNLNNLSEEAGMSRTNFANRFRDMTGDTPPKLCDRLENVKGQRTAK